jgi:hypothetical protein
MFQPSESKDCTTSIVGIKEYLVDTPSQGWSAKTEGAATRTCSNVIGSASLLDLFVIEFIVFSPFIWFGVIRLNKKAFFPHKIRGKKH